MYDRGDEGALNLYQAPALPCLHSQVCDRGAQHTPHQCDSRSSHHCGATLEHSLSQKGEQRQAQISMFQKETGVFPPNFVL